MLDYAGLRNSLVVTAFWKAKPDETEAVAGILRRFVPQAQKEPGVRAFMIHQSKSEPSEFFFYEAFDDEAAFAAHQQTPHFKALIAGEALPKLVKRERAQYAPIYAPSGFPSRHGRACPGHRRLRYATAGTGEEPQP
jgi:quinol monooxygenase YgiN